jgi:hypothetical protein
MVIFIFSDRLLGIHTSSAYNLSPDSVKTHPPNAMYAMHAMLQVIFNHRDKKPIVPRTNS